MASAPNTASEGGRVFRIEGQGIYPRRDGDGDKDDHVSSADEDEVQEPESDIVREVMSVNRNLLQKIDILRLRLEVDRKNNDKNRKAAGGDRDRHAKQKNTEMNFLQKKLESKENVVHQLGEMNKQKSNEILLLEKNIDDLKKEVLESRVRAQDLHSEITKLQKEREAFSQNKDAKERDKEIKILENEINQLRSNLDTMEKELLRANELITKQGGKIVLLENENKNMQVKFKEDVNRLAVNMRLEIEKMRDVMKQQNDEMRGLRQQNEAMGKDIRDIKMLLEASNENKRDNVKSPRYLKVLNPTLPPLTQDNKFSNRGNRK